MFWHGDDVTMVVYKKYAALLDAMTVVFNQREAGGLNTQRATRIHTTVAQA